MALALAPNAMKTVEKPATNNSAATHASRAAPAACGFGVGEPLERRAREIDEIGRHQRQHAGRQEAQKPRDSAAAMETSAVMAP